MGERWPTNCSFNPVINYRMYFQGNWYLEQTSKHGGHSRQPAQNQSMFLGLTQRIWQRWEEYLSPALTWIRNKQNKHILWFFTTQSTHKHVVPVGCLYPRGGPCPYCNCCENESSRPSLCPPGNFFMLTALLFSSDLLQQEHLWCYYNFRWSKKAPKNCFYLSRLGYVCELCRPSISDSIATTWFASRVNYDFLDYHKFSHGIWKQQANKCSQWIVPQLN